MQGLLEAFSDNQKRVLVFIHDALMASIAWPLALIIRFGNLSFDFHPLIDSILICFVCKVIAFSLFKLSRGIWKFSSTMDLVIIAKAITFASVLSVLVLFFWNRLDAVPRSALFIDWILIGFLLGGSRFAYRIKKDSKNSGNRTDKTLIIGANETSEQLIREILRDAQSPILPVGIVEQMSAKRHNRTIHGIAILGGLSKLEEIIKKKEATHAVSYTHLTLPTKA